MPLLINIPIAYFTFLPMYDDGWLFTVGIEAFLPQNSLVDRAKELQRLQKQVL